MGSDLCDREQTTTPGLPCPTLCEWCIGSFTSHRVMNIEGLRGEVSAAPNSAVPHRAFQRHGRWKCTVAKNVDVKDITRVRVSVSKSLRL